MSEFRKTYPGGLYFITMSVVGWADVFIRRDYAEIIIDSLIFSQSYKALEIYAYVIMTNHIHLVVSRKEGIIGDWVRDFKTYTSKKLMEAVLKNSQESRKDWMSLVFNYHGVIVNGKKGKSFWQNGYFPIDLTSNFLIDQKVNYIHQNPVKAGFVNNPEDWRLSSANIESPIKVLEI